MKFNKILVLGAIAALGLSSCGNEEFPFIGSQTGTMSLAVDYKEPTATRAVNAMDFPVEVHSLNVPGFEVLRYDRAGLVPTQLTLPVGTFYAKAHTPGNLDKVMDAPYYMGIDTFEIVKGITTHSTVMCRMANSSIAVSFINGFENTFATWSVSVTDNDEVALNYDNETHGINPPTKYVKFKENTEYIYVNFAGKTTTGFDIRDSKKLSKVNFELEEQYDDDSRYFSGGESIVLKFKAVESTDGKIEGIGLTADVTFEESDTTVNMDVTDVLPEDGGEEEPGDEPTDPSEPTDPGEGGEDNPNAVTLSLPSDMVVTALTDPSLGDTYIAAENGLKSVKVKIASTSPDMMGALVDLGGAYEGIDFVNGTEVVGCDGLVSLFSDLGQTLNVPAEGDTEYTFPIGNFFVFLSILPGDHTFMLTVTDMDGNSKEGQLTLTVE